MKKMLCILCMLFAGCSAKKEVTPIVTPPDPQPVYYSVTAVIDTTGGGNKFGSISPANISVKKGSSLSVSISTQEGWHVSAASVNGSAAVVTDNTIAISNIDTNMNVSVILTDTLTATQMDSVKNLSYGKWQGVIWEKKPTAGTVFNWEVYSIPPCQLNDFDVLNAAGTWATYTFCGGGPAAQMRDSGSWAISFTGKQITFTNKAGQRYTDDFSVTKDTLVTIYHDPVTKFDYREKEVRYTK